MGSGAWWVRAIAGALERICVCSRKYTLCMHMQYVCVGSGVWLV